MKKEVLNEANEQIKRALLMMKYDTSKTLTENEESVKVLNEDAKVAGAAIGGGALAGGLGAAAGATGLAAATTGSLASAGGLAGAIGIKLGAVGGTAIATTGFAVLGGLAGAALIPLAYWWFRKDTGPAEKVKEFFQYCTTMPNLKKLERKLNDNEIRDYSDQIYDALNHSTLGFMAGTDEEKLFSVFKSVGQGSASDMCALYDTYTRSRGDLYEELDSDIDSPDEWEQIFRPVRNCFEDTLKNIAEESAKCDTTKGEVYDPVQKKCITSPITTTTTTLKPGEGGGEKEKRKGGGSSYKLCSNPPFEIYCKNSLIRKAQGCLGLKTDGALGPKTKAALENAGAYPLDQSGIDKVCSGSKTSDKINVELETGSNEASDTNAP